MKNQSVSSHLSSLRLDKGEMIIDIDGTVTTQPVLQHLGISAWPGASLIFFPSRVCAFLFSVCM
jgi:hypothetical protein